LRARRLGPSRRARGPRGTTGIRARLEGPSRQQHEGRREDGAVRGPISSLRPSGPWREGAAEAHRRERARRWRDGAAFSKGPSLQERGPVSKDGQPKGSETARRSPARRLEASSQRAAFLAASTRDRPKWSLETAPSRMAFECVVSRGDGLFGAGDGQRRPENPRVALAAFWPCRRRAGLVIPLRRRICRLRGRLSTLAPFQTFSNRRKGPCKLAAPKALDGQQSTVDSGPFCNRAVLRFRRNREVAEEATRGSTSGKCRHVLQLQQAAGRTASSRRCRGSA